MMLLICLMSKWRKTLLVVEFWGMTSGKYLRQSMTTRAQASAPRIRLAGWVGESANRRAKAMACMLPQTWYMSVLHPSIGVCRTDQLGPAAPTSLSRDATCQPWRRDGWSSFGNKALSGDKNQRWGRLKHGVPTLTAQSRPGSLSTWTPPRDFRSRTEFPSLHSRAWEQHPAHKHHGRRSLSRSASLSAEARSIQNWEAVFGHFRHIGLCRCETAQMLHWHRCQQHWLTSNPPLNPLASMSMVSRWRNSSLLCQWKTFRIVTSSKLVTTLKWRLWWGKPLAARWIVSYSFPTRYVCIVLTSHVEWAPAVCRVSWAQKVVI